MFQGLWVVLVFGFKINVRFFCDLHNNFWTFTSKQTDVGKRIKDLQKVMEKLCEARRTRISQIQKYLFPIQVNPVFQVLGTPPLKDVNTDISKGVCLQH